MYQAHVSGGETVEYNGRTHTVYRPCSELCYSATEAIKQAQRVFAHAPLHRPVSVTVDDMETFSTVWRLDGRPATTGA